MVQVLEVCLAGYSLIHLSLFADTDRWEEHVDGHDS